MCIVPRDSLHHLMPWHRGNDAIYIRRPLTAHSDSTGRVGVAILRERMCFGVVCKLLTAYFIRCKVSQNNLIKSNYFIKMLQFILMQFIFSGGIAVIFIRTQWNLSVTTTSKIKFITCDLFSNVFYEHWRYLFTIANNVCLLELI